MRRRAGGRTFISTPEGDPRPTDPKYQRSICLIGSRAVLLIRWQDEEEEE